jgi:serine/threonine protein kinase
VIKAIKNKNCKGLLTYYDGVYEEKKRFAYIITEDYKGCCKDVEDFKKKFQINSDELIGNFREIVMSLRSLHGMSVSHMDITPKNFYVVGNHRFKVIKLGGFGLALLKDPDNNNTLFQQRYFL